MKNKDIIILVTSSVLLIGFVFGAHYFYKKTNSTKEDIISLSGDVSALKIQADRLISLRQVAASTGDELTELAQFFVPADGALAFVEYVENLAQKSALTYRIESFDVVPDPKLTEQDKELLRTSIRTTGTLKNTKLFLSLIESLPYNVKVSRADLRRTSPSVGVAVTKDEWSLIIDFTVVKISEK